jgi:hypothetical protein
MRKCRGRYWGTSPGRQDISTLSIPPSYRPTTHICWQGSCRNLQLMSIPRAEKLQLARVFKPVFVLATAATSLAAQPIRLLPSSRIASN